MTGFKLINTFDHETQLSLCLMDPSRQGIEAVEEYCRHVLDITGDVIFYSERLQTFITPGKTFDEQRITEGDTLILMEKPSNLEFENEKGGQK